MAKCPFCDHFNRTGASTCEKCGAPLGGISRSEPAMDQEAPPTPEPGSLEEEILGLMRGEKKIEAIKLYRARKGVDLKGAKDAVEALAAKHGIAPTSGGCAGMVLLMVAASAAAAVVLLLLMIA
jgi:hypothetical protein